HEIKGAFRSGGQYHYSMETQSCVCVPMEDSIDVYPSSQWMDLIQVSIATCLNVQHNRINVHVRRLGGSYGSKISRNAQISCACALACYLLNRPARFIMTMESNMLSIGKRCPMHQIYGIEVNDDGVIQSLDTQHWSECGSSPNEPHAGIITYFLKNCYLIDNWNIRGYEVITGTPSNTFCRASGFTEGLAMIENMMEHIAIVANKDPIAVRLANMNDNDKSVLDNIIQKMLNMTYYIKRQISIWEYNRDNRWKKKGIAMVPMKYWTTYVGQFNTILSVCARDGSVCVTLSGIEINQGINTKIAQIAAHTLGIDIELISVKQSNNSAAPNMSETGHNVTIDTCGYATIQVCTQILKRLEPIKKKMENPKWQDVIFKAFQEGIDLYTRYSLTLSGSMEDTLKPYPVYGVTIAEIEIDVLTGQHIIRRVDLMVDAGQSLNPEIDVGQVQGAFVMGMGYWTSENLVYDTETGLLINNRSWNYMPPGAKDIPEDFRVYLRQKTINKDGVYGSQTINEPPLCMSFVIPIAIRSALDSARRDSENVDLWFQLGKF
ncbi:Xanthine dehydrogenase, partial [Cyphomyrmex costatus]